MEYPHGSTDVVYLMDFNLKKEMVLDVAALDALPHSPSMVIVNGDCTPRRCQSGPTAASRKRKDVGAGAAQRPCLFDRPSYGDTSWSWQRTYSM